MEISFTNQEDGKKYTLIEKQEIASIGNASLEIKTQIGEPNINLKIYFKNDPQKSDPYREFKVEEGTLNIYLYNFNDVLGSFFPDILKITEDNAIHIYSSYLAQKGSGIRLTKIYFYKMD